MWGLALKDIYVGKKDLILYSSIILLLSIIFLIPWSVEAIDYASILLPVGKYLSIVIGFCCLGAIQQGFMAADEAGGFRNYMCTTPLLSHGVVRERYVMNMFSGLILNAWYYFAVHLQIAMTGQNCGEDILVFALFYFQLFMLSLEMPFYFRFGVQYGNYYKTGIVCVFLFLLLAFGLYGDIGNGNSPDSLLERFITWVAGLDTMQLQKGGFALVAFAPWFSMLCYYVSYRVSCKLYEQSYQN